MGKLLSIPKRIGVALIALLMVITVGFGAAAQANATVKSGTSAGCEYYVDDANYQTTIRATACSSAQAFIQYRNVSTGTVYTGKSPLVGIPMGQALITSTGPVPSTFPILDNYGVFYPGRAGITSFTISTRHS